MFHRFLKMTIINATIYDWKWWPASQPLCITFTVWFQNLVLYNTEICNWKLLIIYSLTFFLSIKNFTLIYLILFFWWQNKFHMTCDFIVKIPNWSILIFITIKILFLYFPFAEIVIFTRIFCFFSSLVLTRLKTW